MNRSTDSEAAKMTVENEPCPQGRTDYDACFAPFRYCPVEGCGRAETPEPGHRWKRVEAAVRAAKVEFDALSPGEQAALRESLQRAGDAGAFLTSGWYDKPRGLGLGHEPTI